MKNNYLVLGGLFACLHLLFVFASKIMAGSEVLLVLFLPLLSTIYTLKSDKKHVVMFVVATVFICSIFDIVSTFIYVVPSLLCGITYGMFRKIKMKELEILCLTSLVHIISISFSFLVIVLLFKEVDFLEIFSSVLNLEGERLAVSTLLILFVLGFGESFIVHMISNKELEKLNEHIESNERVPRWFSYVCISMFVLFVIMYFVKNIYSVFPMLIFMVFYIPYIVEGIMNLKYKVLTVCLVFVFSLIGIFMLNVVNPLNYLMIIGFILTPFIINNFQYNAEKNF